MAPLLGLGIGFITDLVSKYGEKIAVKGIEKVTGMDLSKQEITPEVQQMLLDNEVKIRALDFEKLKLDIESKLEAERIHLETEKAFLGDKSSARNREVEIVKSTGAKDYALYVLAGIIVTAFFVSIIILMKSNLDKASGVYELLLILFGALSTKFGTVVDYFFGSSNTK